MILLHLRFAQFSHIYFSVPIQQCFPIFFVSRQRPYLTSQYFPILIFIQCFINVVAFLIFCLFIILLVNGEQRNAVHNMRVTFVH